MASRWACRNVVPVDNLQGPRGGVADCMVWTDPSKPRYYPPTRPILKAQDDAREFVQQLSGEVAKSHLDEALEEPSPNLRIRVPTPGGVDTTSSGRPLYHKYDGGLHSRTHTPVNGTQRFNETWREYRTSRDPSRSQTFKSTKEYLERYLNRTMSDQEILHVIDETQKRMQNDLEHSATEEHLRRTMMDMKRPPEKYSVPPNWDQQRNYLKEAALVPRPPSATRYQYEQQRPVSAANNRYYHDKPKHVSWDATPREVRLRHNAKPGTHFDSWQPNSTLQTRSQRAITEARRLEEELIRQKLDSAKTRHPLSLGRSYNDESRRISAHYPSSAKSRPQGETGKVNVQLDCAEDSDMTVSLRVQSRSSNRYH